MFYYSVSRFARVAVCKDSMMMVMVDAKNAQFIVQIVQMQLITAKTAPL